MGTLLSYFEGSNEPDPITGFTPREKQLITSSWDLLRKDFTGTGVKLFMLFFKKKPEYQSLFTFGDSPPEELPTTPMLKAHAAFAMHAISSAIDNLDNADVLLILLRKIGELHSEKKIPQESFQVLKESLLELLEASLGSKITGEGLEAWDKTLTMAFKVIVDTLGFAN